MGYFNQDNSRQESANRYQPNEKPIDVSERIAPPPAGDHKGPLHIHSTTLAPTEFDGLCIGLTPGELWTSVSYTSLLINLCLYQNSYLCTSFFKLTYFDIMIGPPTQGSLTFLIWFRRAAIH